MSAPDWARLAAALRYCADAIDGGGGHRPAPSARRTYRKRAPSRPVAASNARELVERVCTSCGRDFRTRHPERFSQCYGCRPPPGATAAAGADDPATDPH